MFYKQLDDNTISYGPFVTNAEYSLDYTMIDSYSQPLPDNWIWFNTVEEAEAHYGVQIN